MLKPTDFPSMGDLKALNEWNHITEADRIHEHYMKAMADRSLPIIEGDMPQEDYPDLRSVIRVEPYLYVCRNNESEWIRACLNCAQANVGIFKRQTNENKELYKSILINEIKHGRIDEYTNCDYFGIYTTLPLNVMNTLANVLLTQWDANNAKQHLVSDDLYQNIKEGYNNWYDWQIQEAEIMD